MYMRLLQLRVSQENLPILKGFYDKIVIPHLQQIKGCLLAELIYDGQQQDKFLSLTLWDAQESVEKYEKSGAFKKLFEQVKPILSESSEWKVQLSQDLELQYVPVAEEPVLKKLSVTAQTGDAKADAQAVLPMCVRIVSAKLKPGKTDEFRKIYTEDVITVLKETQGCLYVYLTENSQHPEEIFSVTLWASKEDAERYEKSGTFAQLVDKTKRTFSQLYQWKMALENNPNTGIRSGENLSVEKYSIITGKKFS
jgi:quinol monooxygenase YgiN